MARTYPLSTSAFFDTLPLAGISCTLGDHRTFSETGGGEVIAAGAGKRLWGGQITLDRDVHDLIAAIDADLAALEEPGASFLIYDARKEYPTADPDGSILGAATPQIAVLDNNNREMRINGLPAGYVLSKGDYIGWAYASNPVRYALHRIVVGGPADGGGLSAKFEVTPYIREGVTVGTPVSLIRPVCKAVIPQASYGRGRSIVSDGGSFAWRQTLR
jgi:hypothetical protein